MPEMRDYELNEFIQYSLSKGISREEIEEILISSGWPKDIIEKTFSRRMAVKAVSRASVIRMEGVTLSFGRHRVLNNVSLAIKPGELFGIIGLSGSGKTTLLNALVGFVEPDSGDIVIRDGKSAKEHSIFKRADLVKTMFGFATQKPSFYEELRVEENIEYFAALYGVPQKEAAARAGNLLNLVGLSDSKDVLAGNLSGGMQKRLDIVCSLIHNPKMLVMDEPTADLDPIARSAMWNLIKEINKRGTTVILASHFLTELEDLCSRVGILHNRKIVEVGTPDELRRIYSKDYEIIVETKEASYDKIEHSLKSRKTLKVGKIVKKGRKLIIYSSKPEATLSYLSKLIEKYDMKLIDVNLNKPTLRELFEYLVKKNEK